MATITNMLPHRAVAVRTGGKPADGGDKLVKIPVGQSAEVEGFDAKDPFHKGLIDSGQIRVGGRGKENDDTRQEQLKADLDAAEKELREANAAVDTAKAAFEADGGQTKDNKDAHSAAKQRLNGAKQAHAAAEKAFNAG